MPQDLYIIIPSVLYLFYFFSFTGPVKSPVKGKNLKNSMAAEGKPDVRRSLRRVEPARRPGLKTLAKQVELQLNTATCNFSIVYPTLYHTIPTFNNPEKKAL